MFTHTDKIVYEGEWLNNKANGKGILKSLKGAYYDGEWLDDY